MTIPVPQLDDRRWADLVREAEAYLRGKTPEWTDFSPGDPGVVLVELFAHLTELMIYRLNRVPDKAYLEYLRLLGLALRPPAAAAVALEFRSDKPATAPIPIPRGVRVSVNRVSGGDEPPVFTTDDPASIEIGQQSVTVRAHHCDFVEGELIGTGTGQPAQAVVVGRPPIIAPTANELDLVIGVEARPDELTERVPARDYDGRPFRIWQEVDSFVNREGDETVYVADRFTGHVVFAPALHEPGEDLNAPPTPLAAVPAAGREIRAWYRRGGGSAGNIPGGAISVLKDTVPGVRKVTNPKAATGGRPAEVLEEALIRGPQDLHSVERAVTADDYESHAEKVVARARAFTKAAIWAHALPGTVQMLLVPHVGEQELSGGRLTPEILHAHETKEAKEQIQRTIDDRRPLGTTCEVNWASYKTVRVKATVHVRREENLEAVKRRLEQRMYATISPLRSDRDQSPGWGFGQALRASHVYDILLKEPGVRFVDGARMFVESAPNTNVLAIARDEFQPNTWYAGAGETVFRSLNDAASWEPAASFPGETVRRIECHPELPGHVVVVTAVTGGSRLHVSLDTGESWDVQELNKPQFVVNDIAWTMQEDKEPMLLLASEVGLYAIRLKADATFSQIQVTPQTTRGFSTIAVAVAAGARNVAVAGTPQGGGGVWLSSEGGATETFRDTKMPATEDIRVLAIQLDVTGTRAFLWAGAAAAGSEDRGKGAWRRELRGRQDPAEGWVPFHREWEGGTCWGLAFHENWVYAATHHGGVARLDSRRADSPWITPKAAESGLPLRDPNSFLFAEFNTVATGPRGLVLAGGDKGVWASEDGKLYESRSETVFTEKVELPSTWLFVSGTHEISVESEGGPSS